MNKKHIVGSGQYNYDNKALITLLGIKDRYLKRLCDNGLLGYSTTATNTGTPKPTSTASSPAATSPHSDISL